MRSIRVAMIALALAAPVCAMPSSASTYKVLHNFCAKATCPDGYWPRARLLRDGAGNIYGTTLLGGSGKFHDSGSGGTVFRLSPNGSGWTFHVLHNFCAQATCADGNMPQSDLIIDTAGKLYGTTVYGGANGWGVVFRLKPSGSGGYSFKVLYNFCSVNGGKSCLDGAAPNGLTYAGASSGAPYDGVSPLYGTTQHGGGGGGDAGAVFSLTPSKSQYWNETVLYAFCPTDCSDGASPTGPLWLDGAGNLFGTAYDGGDNQRGTAFELAPVAGGSWNFARLYSFCAESGCADGELPVGGVIMDSAGNLFGQTDSGGDNFQGVLYKIVPNGASSTYVPLHLFCGTCAEGMNPQSSLFMDGSGNIIATSGSGGLNGRGGAVYRWNGNTMEALYSFCATYPPSCLDGNHSEAGVTSDNAGNLFGTTVYGGHHKVPGTNSPPGVVFELTP